MGQYLNSKEPYDQYKTVMNGPYFVDKTEILEELIPAFFSNTEEPSLFENLSVAKQDQYQKHAGQHDVIYIDFSEMPRECHTYQDYITRIQDGLVRVGRGFSYVFYHRTEFYT